MAWDDDKSTAADPDNPTADEQLSADEWDAHVADQKGHASRHEKGGGDELVTFGDTVHDSIDTAAVSNIHVLDTDPSTTLNSAWDSVRSGFVKGEPNTVLVPPKSDGSPWEIDGSLTFDDPENLTEIWFGNVRVDVTASLSEIFHFSPINKTESITIRGGLFNANGGNATRFAFVEGGARLNFEYVKTTDFGAGNFQDGIVVQSDNFPVGNLRISHCDFDFVSGNSIRIDGTANTISDAYIEDFTGYGDDVIHIRGEVDNPTISTVKGDNGNVTNSVVRLEVTANGAPANGSIRSVNGADAVTGVLVDNPTAASGSVEWMTIEDIHIFNASATQFDADYLRESRIDSFTDIGNDPSLGANSVRCEVRTGYNQNAISVSDSGTYNVINCSTTEDLGVSPTSSPSGQYPEGTSVRNSNADNNETWQLIGGSWVQLA